MQDNIDAEKERAEQAESELDERITSEVSTLNERIDNEVAALEAEDTAIRELITQEVEKLNQSITTETQERKNKSVVSVERIEEDGNRILYKLVLGDGTRLDVPVETYDYADLVLQLQKFDEYDNRITAEEEARKAADDALGARITEEQNARQSADAQLQNNIEAETNARTQADTALQANIDAEKNRATQAETSLDTKISAETNRATEAEEALEQSITNETSAREAADATLQDNIDGERERAVAQENAIKQSVTQEVNRAQQAETELSNDIQQEIANRESAVTGVQNSLDEFKDYVQEDIVPSISESTEKFNDYLPLAGGTMTGPLKVLSPTTDEDAANKKYVDERTTDIATFTITDQTTAAEIYAASKVNAAFRVDRAEDGVIPTVYANLAENKYTVWVQYGHVIRRCTEADGNTRFNSFTTDTFVYDANLQDQLGDYMPKSGGEFTGPVYIQKPVAQNSPVNLKYLIDNYATKDNLTSNYDSLNTKVETAQSTAEAAKSAASAADTKAGQAQTTANEANTAASNAQNTANEANTAASNAQNTANMANSNANKALNRRLINVKNGALAWPETNALTITAKIPDSYLKYDSDITTVEALIVIPRETDPNGDHVNMSTIIKSGENWEITFNKANGEFYSNSQGSLLVTFIVIGS